MRVPLSYTARGSDGSGRPDADVFVYYRSSPFEVPLYAAVSGGSPLTQPLTPDDTGTVAAYAVSPGAYDIVEDYGTSRVLTEWEAVAGTMDPWIAPTLTNSWVDFGGADSTTAYVLSNTKNVYLRGLVRNGVVGSPAFTLPAGYRPSVMLSFGVLSNGTAGSVTVAANGQVVPASGSNVHFSFDGIVFPAEQ